MNIIQPIHSLQAIDSLQSLTGAQKTGSIFSPVSSSSTSDAPAVPFVSMFQDAISNAKQTDATMNSEIAKVATGQSDNLHEAMIASQKATLAVDMVVELRNKFLDAYKEIININV